MNTQALSAPISPLSLLLVQTQAARWKAAGPEQLTGAHLYIDIAKSGYLCHAVGNVMRIATKHKHWNGNVFFTKFSTTFCTASDQFFVNMTSYPFHWIIPQMATLQYWHWLFIFELNIIFHDAKCNFTWRWKYSIWRKRFSKYCEPSFELMEMNEPEAVHIL